MPILTFAFNEDTYNSTITLLEDVDLTSISLNIELIKSFDDEDYYEFDISKGECEITKLKFEPEGDDYIVTFDARINISEEKWQNADEKFKENAENGLIEVEFDLEEDGEILEECFEKANDGLTKLFID